MNFRFTNRIQNTPKSFIREILKVTQDPSIISSPAACPTRASSPSRRCRKPPARPWALPGPAPCSTRPPKGTPSCGPGSPPATPAAA